jgi:hypothetical protein
VQSVFGDRVVVSVFQERGREINLDELADLESRHALKIEKAENPLPRVIPKRPPSSLCVGRRRRWQVDIRWTTRREAFGKCSRRKGVEVFAGIDHSGEAAKAGLQMPAKAAD